MEPITRGWESKDNVQREKFLEFLKFKIYEKGHNNNENSKGRIIMLMKVISLKTNDLKQKLEQYDHLFQISYIQNYLAENGVPIEKARGYSLGDVVLQLALAFYEQQHTDASIESVLSCLEQIAENVDPSHGIDSAKLVLRNSYFNSIYGELLIQEVSELLDLLNEHTTDKESFNLCLGKFIEAHSSFQKYHGYRSMENPIDLMMKPFQKLMNMSSAIVKKMVGQNTHVYPEYGTEKKYIKKMVEAQQEKGGVVIGKINDIEIKLETGGTALDLLNTYYEKEVEKNKEYLNSPAYKARIEKKRTIKQRQEEWDAKYKDTKINEDKIDEQSSLLIGKGFKIWDDLLLIPLHLFSYVPDGTLLTTVSGIKIKIGTDSIPNDDRESNLPFGVLPEQYEEALGWFK